MRGMTTSVDGRPADVYDVAARVLVEQPALSLLLEHGGPGWQQQVAEAARAVVDAVRSYAAPPPARLLPTGACWCGCGTEVGAGSFFAHGHDKRVEAALLAAEYEGQVARLLAAHGYGPGRSVVGAAVESGRWERCRCGYPGRPDTVRLHQRNSGHGGTAPPVR
jgi:hypothetical protein